MAELERPQINMSSIKVAGVGGLGMIAIVGVMAYALPEVRAFALVSLVGGIIVGTAFIAYRRWRRSDPPNRPTLMVDTPAATMAQKSEPVRIDARVKLAPVASAK